MDSRGLLWAIGLGAAALALVVLSWRARTPAPPSSARTDRALDRALGAVLDQGGLDKLGPARSQGLSELRKRVPVSAAFLSPRDLQLWADVRLHVAQLSPQACALFWTGGDNPAAVSALDRFSDEELRQWAELTARGVALSLEGKPPPYVAPEALARGFAAVATRLPADARARFEADARSSQLSEARACQMFEQLVSGARSLMPEQQDELLRALANGATAAPR